eukprot:gene14599-biopygen9650
MARAWRGHGAGVARAIGHFWLGVARAWRGHSLFPQAGETAEDASGTRPFLQIPSCGTRPHPFLPGAQNTIFCGHITLSGTQSKLCSAQDTLCGAQITYSSTHITLERIPGRILGYGGSRSAEQKIYGSHPSFPENVEHVPALFPPLRCGHPLPLLRNATWPVPTPYSSRTQP